ncbi:MAG: TatD family hydrolase [archaeon]
MKLVDVHAHLESSKFDGDLDEVIRRFVDAGGRVVINSGTSPERNRECLELARRYDCVRASFGFYPVGNFSKDVDKEIEWIRERLSECVAVGEIGLDFAEGRGDMERQVKLFKKMLGFAKEVGLPVVIHSRKAEAEAIEILEEFGMKKVVMHCFCGRKSLIKRCVENGWSFSVPPAIMRWDNFRMLVESVPIEQLLTETDSPYLSSVAGERNEPVNVLVTLKEIARIKGLSVEEVSEKIWGNAGRMFGF